MPPFDEYTQNIPGSQLTSSRSFPQTMQPRSKPQNKEEVKGASNFSSKSLGMRHLPWRGGAVGKGWVWGQILPGRSKCGQKSPHSGLAPNTHSSLNQRTNHPKKGIQSREEREHRRAKFRTVYVLQPSRRERGKTLRQSLIENQSRLHITHENPETETHSYHLLSSTFLKPLNTQDAFQRVPHGRRSFSEQNWPGIQYV